MEDHYFALGKVQMEDGGVTSTFLDLDSSGISTTMERNTGPESHKTFLITHQIVINLLVQLAIEYPNQIPQM